MKKYLTIFICNLLFSTSCNKTKEFTVYDYIDKKYDFTHTDSYLSECEPNLVVNEYYLRNNKDSIFRVDVLNCEETRAGWVYKGFFTGEWNIYDKTNKLKKNVDYVRVCETSHVNSVKHIKDGEIIPDKGYFLEYNSLKDTIKVNEETTMFFNIKGELNQSIFPKIVYLFHDEHKDLCHFIDKPKDSIVMLENVLHLKGVAWKKKGVKFIQGYVLFNENAIYDKKRVPNCIPVFFKKKIVVIE